MIKKTKRTSSSGLAGNTFATVQGTDGTSPSADSTSDILSLVSSDDTLIINGDALTDSLDFKVNVPGTNQKLTQRDSAGDFKTVETMSVNGVDGLDRLNEIDVANSGGGSTVHSKWVELSPSVNSPNDTWTLEYSEVKIDPDSLGFSIGTNGNAAIVHNSQLTHEGTSDSGALAVSQNNITVGNGTDPIDVKGIGYFFGFGVVRDGVNLTGPVQGYGFQPTIEDSATMDVTNSYVSAFYDTTTIDCECSWYTSFSSSPIIASIANNRNWTGMNLNPTIPVFTGNASCTAISVAGQFGTFDTGSFTGINVNPTVDDVDNAIGINVSMDNVTATSKQAAYLDGDVAITGSLSFGGALSIGQLNAYSAQTIVTGGGTPQSVHSLISGMNLGASQTVTLADYIGVNTAAIIEIGDSSSVSSSFLGLAALALPAVVKMGAGATLDRASGATFAVSLDATATGGTIDTLDLCRALALPNGITAITNLTGFKMDLPFGDPGTTTWGVYISPTVHNYMAGSLMVGGTAGSDDTVANSSVGIELKSTTRAFLNARMTTTERNALTAVNGMQIYNSTTDKLQVYAAGSWVDLH